MSRILKAALPWRLRKPAWCRIGCVPMAVAVTMSVSAAHAAEPASALLHQMVGQWTVQQRMWPAPDAAAVDLPPARAQRTLVGGSYLVEQMLPRDTGAAGDADFRRDATFNFNPVTARWEYASLDTRAPQLMTERSEEGAAAATPEAVLNLHGGTFLAPTWGEARNVRFSYRLTIGPVADGRQTVQLFLTPQTVMPRREFKAFEYVYTAAP